MIISQIIINVKNLKRRRQKSRISVSKKVEIYKLFKLIIIIKRRKLKLRRTLFFYSSLYYSCCWRTNKKIENGFTF